MHCVCTRAEPKTWNLVPHATPAPGPASAVHLSQPCLTPLGTAQMRVACRWLWRLTAHRKRDANMAQLINHQDQPCSNHVPFKQTCGFAAAVAGLGTAPAWHNLNSKPARNLLWRWSGLPRNILGYTSKQSAEHTEHIRKYAEASETEPVPKQTDPI